MDQCSKEHGAAIEFQNVISDVLQRNEIRVIVRVCAAFIRNDTVDVPSVHRLPFFIPRLRRQWATGNSVLNIPGLLHCLIPSEELLAALIHL